MPGRSEFTALRHDAVGCKAPASLTSLRSSRASGAKDLRRHCLSLYFDASRLKASGLSESSGFDGSEAAGTGTSLHSSDSESGEACNRKDQM